MWCIKTYSTRQHDTFKWLLLVHHQLLLLKCEPSQERVKFNYVTSVNKCRAISHNRPEIAQFGTILKNRTIREKSHNLEV